VFVDHDQIGAVRTLLQQWQHDMIAWAEHEEGHAKSFRRDQWSYSEAGGGTSAVLESGKVFEKIGANFSEISASELPVAATQRRPDLSRCPYRVLGVSIVAHPLNPFVPTVHANARYFEVERADGQVVWWFGGGCDLTPYYGFDEDCVLWHQHAKTACDVYSPEAYYNFKQQCDDYFYLPHRQESRGVGGIFFDDLNLHGFEHSVQFTKEMIGRFQEAYSTIVSRRKHHPWHKEHQDFQRYRRGRYVELNLLHDRGTLFGLQSGGRTESILMSLPPTVSWQYDRQFDAGSAEARLTEHFLKPRDWLK
jgi:coproporphyrinogen III oxidase